MFNFFKKKGTPVHQSGQGSANDEALREEEVRKLREEEEKVKTLLREIDTVAKEVEPTPRGDTSSSPVVSSPAVSSPADVSQESGTPPTDRTPRADAEEEEEGMLHQGRIIPSKLKELMDEKAEIIQAAEKLDRESKLWEERRQALEEERQKLRTEQERNTLAQEEITVLERLEKLESERRQLGEVERRIAEEESASLELIKKLEEDRRSLGAKTRKDEV